MLDNFFENRISMKVDVKKTENEYLLEAELPGYDKENISLEYKDNYLTISAKKEAVVDESKDNYIRKERSYGEVKRTFYVEDLDKENIKARYKDGILQVIMPKLQKEADTSSKIEIE